ncbi:MAG: nucleotide exchange factor GrpE [Bacteroidetes bacterium CG23_combo_of_CG06-09_8_20_14_all_32_9]|nr:MAG: nucleotide exchange factor GrpE [Bacteroidetes bacterium CG23_combo_of_CG06-09_8_20_14_all_32_9]
MNSRQQLKEYINKAIDTLGDEDCNWFAGLSNEPDLMHITNELLSLKGEIKKNNDLSLKLNNEVVALIEKQKVSDITDEDKIAPDLFNILTNLPSIDELIIRTKKHFEEIPDATLFSFKNYKTHLKTWKKGYDILNEKWNNFISETGLIRTGNLGETFNPAYHEAVDTSNNTKFENNQITDCEEIGYLYKNVLIRRAKTVVNKLSNNI